MVLAALLVAVVVGAPAVSATAIQHSTHRDDRTFLINSATCEEDGKQGSCLPYFQCERVFEGTVADTCRLVGQCCVFERTCDGESSARVTYFNSDDLDIADGNTCSLTITKAAGIEDLCQLHILAKELELTEPSPEGECDKQYFEVKGGNDKDPVKLCGTNTNQNLVVDVEGQTGPFKVAVESLEENMDSSWEVEVKQVACDSPDLAPRGCHQYFTGVSGKVKSFNYDNSEASTSTQSNGKPGSRQLQESYTICVKPEEGYCSVKWTAVSEEYAFSINDNLDSNISPPVIDGGARTDDKCGFTDYVLITEATVKDEGTATIFCGSGFPEAVYTDSFKIRVVTNEKEFEDEDIDNRGFHLKYEQQRC